MVSKVWKKTGKRRLVRSDALCQPAASPLNHREDLDPIQSRKEKVSDESQEKARKYISASFSSLSFFNSCQMAFRVMAKLLQTKKHN